MRYRVPHRERRCGADAVPRRLVRCRPKTVRSRHVVRPVPLDPGAARILRPGGGLVMYGNSYLLILTMPETGGLAGERLQRAHFGMYRFERTGGPGVVEFHIPHGDMIKLLRRSGFEVQDLI